MFARLLVVVGMAGFHCATSAQLVVFSFNGSSGNEATFAVDSQPANGSVSVMSRGSGLNTSSGSGTFSSRSWSTNNAVDLTDYYRFSITPSNGFQLNLTSLELDERRSGTGIRQWSVRSNLDDFASDLSPSPFSVPDNTATRTERRIPLSGANFSRLRSEVEFRIYGYQAERSTGTWRIDNVKLAGQIALVPEPDGWLIGTSMALLSLGFCWHHRRRQRRLIAGQTIVENVQRPL